MPAHKVRARVRTKSGSSVVVFPETIAGQVLCTEEGTGKEIRLDEVINQHTDEINAVKNAVGNFPTSLPANGGNADTAKKLATARTIRTNLGSTSTASFDGSSNITPGVTGTLAKSNGGTGNTTGDADTVDGKHADNFQKAFETIVSGNLIGDVFAPGLYWSHSTGVSDLPRANYAGGFVTFSSSSTISGMKFQIFGSIIGQLYFRVDNESWQQVATIDNPSNFRPTTDNSYTLGDPGMRWSQAWLANSAIQTSDERAKTDIINSPLGLDFITKLRPVVFKYKVGENIITQEPDNEEEVEIQPELKDDDGNIIQERKMEKQIKYKEVITPRPGKRNHYGLLAQQVKEVLGDTDFGGYVYDAETDTYGLRYEEFIAPLICAIQELKQEINDLKSNLGL